MPTMDIQRRRSLTSLALPLGILLAAAGLRAYWVIHHEAPLMGVGYIRIAENLLDKGSYVGLFEGPELVVPPFFPVLLAVGALVTGSLEGAARLIPFLAGVLLVPIGFVLARLIYGPRVALGFAALIALHPAFIELSTITESETVYLPLM